MRLSRYLAVSPLIRDKVTDKQGYVVFATRTAEVRIMPAELWSLLNNDQLEGIPPHIQEELASIEILVPTNEDELATVIDRQREGIQASSRTLYLVVQPTATCQLGCDYCGQKHSQKRLSVFDQDEFIRQAADQLEKGVFDSLQIAWFGAEPLLGLREMRRMTKSFRRLCNKEGIIYTSKIVTNGLSLKPSVANELVNKLGVHKVEVTIDGDAEFHDEHRPTKSGRQTYKRIFENVIQFTKAHSDKCQITIRCNVDSRNYEGVERLLREIADQGIQDKLGFYTAPIHSWGNDAHLNSLMRKEYASREIEWLALMMQLGFTPSLLPPLKPVVCIAVMPSGVAIDAFGELHNCTEVSMVPAYEKIEPSNNANQHALIPTLDLEQSVSSEVSPPLRNMYAIGHVQSGELAGTRKNLGDFNDRVERGEFLCSSCTMLPVCGGACPKIWHEGLTPCPSAKDNINERLMLYYAANRVANT